MNKYWFSSQRINTVHNRISSCIYFFKIIRFKGIINGKTLKLSRKTEKNIYRKIKIQEGIKNFEKH